MAITKKKKDISKVMKWFESLSGQDLLLGVNFYREDSLNDGPDMKVPGFVEDPVDRERLWKLRSEVMNMPFDTPDFDPEKFEASVRGYILSGLRELSPETLSQMLRELSASGLGEPLSAVLGSRVSRASAGAGEDAAEDILLGGSGLSSEKRRLVESFSKLKDIQSRYDILVDCFTKAAASRKDSYYPIGEFRYNVEHDDDFPEYSTRSREVSYYAVGIGGLDEDFGVGKFPWLKVVGKKDVIESEMGKVVSRTVVPFEGSLMPGQLRKVFDSMSLSSKADLLSLGGEDIQERIDAAIRAERPSPERACAVMRNFVSSLGTMDFTGDELRELARNYSLNMVSDFRPFCEDYVPVSEFEKRLDGFPIGILRPGGKPDDIEVFTLESDGYQCLAYRRWGLYDVLPDVLDLESGRFFDVGRNMEELAFDVIHKAYGIARPTDEVIRGDYAQEFAGEVTWSRAIDLDMKDFYHIKGLRYIDFEDCTNVRVLFDNGDSCTFSEISKPTLVAIADELSKLMKKAAMTAGNAQRKKSFGPRF